jgi:tetratricopeptide (TPR) repeat protein
MKSDHRHELKTNELADWIANFPEWANENRNSLVAAAAVILVALLVYFVSFYRKNVVAVGNQTQLTTLVTEVPQQMSRIASATMQGQDESYILVQTEQDLQDFAQKSSNNDMAALALIQRGAAARAELHYRLSEISHDELVKQMEKAQTSYQQALDRKPSLPSLAAAAQYGLGLCEEELGSFDKAAEIYRAVAQKPEYAGTSAQAAAAYRLKVMPDYKTAVAFQPAPPKPIAPAAPTIQVQPGAASAPTVTVTPPAATAAPAPAGDAAKTNAAPAATPAPQTQTPAPASAPAPVAAPSKSDTNAPKSN